MAKEDEFELELGGPEYTVKVHVPVSLASQEDPQELAHRIVQHHNLPIYMHPKLSESLQEFALQSNDAALKRPGRDLLAALTSHAAAAPLNIAAFWQQQQQQQQEEPESSEGEEALLYHSFVHSREGLALLRLEHQYSKEVAMLVKRRHAAILSHDAKQAAKLAEAVSQSCSDAQVNALSSRALEASELLHAEWESSITALKEQQLRNFRAVVREGRVAGAASGADEEQTEGVGAAEDAPLLQESFTIHLGTQLKQMHNLRLIAADPVHLCDYTSHSAAADSQWWLPPQRIQTSLELYGRQLSGLVNLVDDRVNCLSGTKLEFGDVCSRATELHFPELQDQLAHIRERLLPQLCRGRLNPPAPDTPRREDKLQPGDVYITRHSNLSGVHVVFHVVCDDSVNSSSITSRHPVILGLRNVLKVACLCDITTLSLPLLLVSRLTEELSAAWCQRRAEIVYKCVKGFMMEMTSWGGSEMNTLQFVLPQNISEAQFQALAAMLPSIFRVSNPLMAA
ncbi:protein C12orf4 [Hyalella azteca]|uniref:Protein C12orf4 n=1 Tax=Hyalella azteca TaxID=294128 RepID=A0A8B7P1V4_HYAAZ|nr:protein C12orf4 [Hyalella azteca]